MKKKRIHEEINWYHPKFFGKKINKELFNDLVEEFGLDKVKSNQPNYTINLKDAEKLFNILNLHIFKNKLPKTPLLVEKFNKNKHTINGQGFIGRYEIEIDLKTVTPEQLNNGNIKDLKPIIKIILVDNGQTYFCNYISILCHEMIHEEEILFESKSQAVFDKIYQKMLNKNINTDYDQHDLFFEHRGEEIFTTFGLKIATQYDEKEKYDMITDTEIQNNGIILQVDKDVDKWMKIAKRIQSCFVDKNQILITITNESIKIGII